MSILVSICIHWLLVNSVHSPSLHQVPNDVLKQAERKLLKIKEQEEQLLKAAEKAATTRARESEKEPLNLPRTAAVSKVSNGRENGVHSGGKMATEQLTELGPHVKENGAHHSDRTTVQEQQGITYYTVIKG